MSAEREDRPEAAIHQASRALDSQTSKSLLPLPSPPPEGAEWIDAHRRWSRGRQPWLQLRVKELGVGS